MTHKIHIITRNNPPCPFCIRAKNMLQLKGLGFTEDVIGESITREEVLEQYPGIKTIPVIIIDGQLIGGSDKLETWLKGN